MKLLKEHEERKASGKPFTDEEYAEADDEDKAKMDDYAEFCAYLAEREAMDTEEPARERPCAGAHPLRRHAETRAEHAARGAGCRAPQRHRAGLQHH